MIGDLAGDDVIDASTVGTAMQLTANGDDGGSVLVGSALNDVLTGGAGDDVLIGEGGQDVLDGGTGSSIVIPSVAAKVGSRRARLAGALAVHADVAPPQQFAGTTMATASTSRWQAASSRMTRTCRTRRHRSCCASPVPAMISGLAGDDVIDASRMASPSMRFILDGGDGNDVLHGGMGNDLLIGGAGADRFAFSGSNGIDTIADFQHGLDAIEISGYGAALASFSDLAGHITQVGADVQVDLGAKVAGAGMIVLQHTEVATVGASDFKFS